MRTLRREFEQLVDYFVPVFIDLEQLERLATADELHVFDGECSVHDGCRPIRAN